MNTMKVMTINAFIIQWESFGGIVAKGIHEMMMIKCEAIGK